MRTRFFLGVSVVGIIYCLINVAYVASHLSGTPDGNILTYTVLQSVLHLLSLGAHSYVLWREKATLLEENAELRAQEREQTARQDLARQHLLEIEPMLANTEQLQQEVRDLITLLSDETPVAREYIPVALRRAIIARDHQTCTYCSRRGTDTSDAEGLTWHIDHVVPVSRGGPTSPTNLTLACANCNLRKGDLSPLEFMQRNRGIL